MLLERFDEALMTDHAVTLGSAMPPTASGAVSAISRAARSSSRAAGTRRARVVAGGP